jgi:hypothetical protein
MRKSLTLLPAGVLAAAIIGSACAPPPPPPPPPPPTTTPTTPPPVGTTSCAAAGSASPGPDGTSPISSWGVDGQAKAAVVIGNVVYVGGSFNNAVSPTGASAPRTNLAAFCLADGNLLSTFSANFGGGPVNALATDGANLFVGGNFTTLNGVASNRLVKLNAGNGQRITSFAPAPIPPPGGVTDGVLALAYTSANGGVLYAGGDFGRIGTGAGAGQSTQVGNAAGFTSTGTLTSFTGDTDKKVESIAVSPSGDAVFLGGFFTTAKATPRAQLAKIDVATNTLAGSNLAIGAHVLDITATGSNDVTAAVGAAIGMSGTGRRFVAFSGATPLLNDVNPKGDVNGLEIMAGIDYFSMLKGYGVNSGPNLVGVDPTQAVGSANYQRWSTTAIGGLENVKGLASGGGHLVAVGDFTTVGSTAGLHGVAIFS